MKTNSLSESSPVLRQQFKTRTRDAIIDAAADAFARESAARVRMEDIAARAGIAVGTLYNYFHDRSALVGALLESRTRGLLDSLDAAVNADASFPERLGRFVQVLADHFEANRPLVSFLLDEERSHGHDANTASRRYSLQQEVLVRAERLLVEGVRDRALREGDPSMYAALLVGMIRGMVSIAVTGNTRLGDAATAIVGVFLTGAGRR